MENQGSQLDRITGITANMAQERPLRTPHHQSGTNACGVLNTHRQDRCYLDASYLSDPGRGCVLVEAALSWRSLS